MKPGQQQQQQQQQQEVLLTSSIDNSSSSSSNDRSSNSNNTGRTDSNKENFAKAAATMDPDDLRKIFEKLNSIQETTDGLVTDVAAIGRDVKSIKGATPETSIMPDIFEDAVLGKRNLQLVTKAVLREPGYGSATWTFVGLRVEGALKYFAVSCSHCAFSCITVSPKEQRFVELPPRLSELATRVGLLPTSRFGVTPERKDDIVLLELDKDKLEAHYETKFGFKMLDGVIVDGEGKSVVPEWPNSDELERIKQSRAKDVGGYSMASKVVGTDLVWDDNERVFKFIRKSSGQPGDSGTLMFVVEDTEGGKTKPIAVGLYSGIELLKEQEQKDGVKALGKIVPLPENPGIAFVWVEKVENPGKLVLRMKGGGKPVEFNADRDYKTMGSFREKGEEKFVYGVVIKKSCFEEAAEAINDSTESTSQGEGTNGAESRERQQDAKRCCTIL